MSIEVLMKSIDAAEKNLAALKKELDNLIKEAQENCPHPDLSVFELDSQPPWRVCVLCGHTEEGWYCGFSRLRPGDSVPIMRHEKFYKYTKGPFHSNEWCAEDKTRSPERVAWAKRTGQK